VSQSRDEIEVAQQRLDELEEQIQDREDHDMARALARVAPSNIVPAPALLGDVHAPVRAMAMFRDEFHIAHDNARAHDLHQMARWALRISIPLALGGVLAWLVFRADTLPLIVFLPMTCAFFVLTRRRLPRGWPTCPMCKKPCLYTSHRRAYAHEVDELLLAEDERCANLSAVPWFAELRKMFRRTSRKQQRQAIYEQMLSLARQMSVCERHCADCSARTAPFWTRTRNVDPTAFSNVN